MADFGLLGACAFLVEVSRSTGFNFTITSALTSTDWSVLRLLGIGSGFSGCFISLVATCNTVV